jgi:uncharacterized protein DUF4157
MGRPDAPSTRHFEKSDAPLREELGHGFAEVRVHTDDTAAALAAGVGADAFTRGTDIYFGAGKYQPKSLAGQELLRHELAHVLQQASGEVSEFAGRVVPPEHPSEAHARSHVALGRQALMPSLTARPAMLARQPASSWPGEAATAEPPRPAPHPGARRDPAPPVSQPSRNLAADFLHALEEKASSLPLPRRIKYVALVSAEPIVALRYTILADGSVTLLPSERSQAAPAFADAVAKFVPSQRKAIQQELTKDPARGVELWAEVLRELQSDPRLNLASFEGMKDQVENVLLTATAARAERSRGKLPPGHETAVPTLRRELGQLRTQMVEAYALGIQTWQVPEDAAFDTVSLAAGAGTAASGAGSVLTALPGMVGAEAAAGVGLAVGTLGVGLIVAGTAAAIYAIWRQAEQAKEENRRRIIEAGVKRELVDAVAKVFDRMHEHEDFFVTTLMIEADKQKMSLASPRPE